MKTVIDGRTGVDVLLPAKAVWWPAESMLVVSDLHLAKAEHFRSQGLAVPPTVDFKRFLVDLGFESMPTQDAGAWGFVSLVAQQSLGRL